MVKPGIISAEVVTNVAGTALVEVFESFEAFAVLSISLSATFIGCNEARRRNQAHIQAASMHASGVRERHEVLDSRAMHKELLSGCMPRDPNRILELTLRKQLVLVDLQQM